ncbi:MAG: hypothetical protein NWE99_01210 [Candidatus Bathyarchaeota archaeon]|nr:hypothetical protein [Candidatus Bathyarchaeota archaeon]
MVEPELKALVEKVAATIGISQSDYVRLVVLNDLKGRGYLKETALSSPELLAPVKPDAR